MASPRSACLLRSRRWSGSLGRCLDFCHDACRAELRYRPHADHHLGSGVFGGAGFLPRNLRRVVGDRHRWRRSSRRVPPPSRSSLRVAGHDVGLPPRTSPSDRPRRWCALASVRRAPPSLDRGRGLVAGVPSERPPWGSRPERLSAPCGARRATAGWLGGRQEIVCVPVKI